MTKREKAVYLLVRTSLTQKEIAKELNTTEVTISRWKKDEEFKQLLREEQDRFLKDLSAPAIRTINELLKSHSDYVRLQAAQDILNRTGYKPTDKVDLSSNVTLIFEDDYGDE